MKGHDLAALPCSDIYYKCKLCSCIVGSVRDNVYFHSVKSMYRKSGKQNREYIPSCDECKMEEALG